MINIYKYDVVVVKFPFASSLKYKARPAVVVSSELYNNNSRETLLILAISSSGLNALNIEPKIKEWHKAGLLKPSIFKSAIVTIQKDFIITKLGRLGSDDIDALDRLINAMCD